MSSIFESDSEIIAHYGILGMKWGVRRTDEQLGKKTPTKPSSRTKSQSLVSRTIASAKRRQAEGAERRKESSIAKMESRKSIQEKVSKLKSSELQERINRMNLEKQYISLLAERKTKRFQSAKKVVGEIVAGTAKDVGTAYLTKMLKDALDIPYKGKKE